MTSVDPIKELAHVITKISSPALMENFLKNILTPAELDEIAQRLQIFKMLKKGVAQRTVADQLGVSIATVSRGARELKYGAPGIHKLFA